ncbi:hypothetical protein [Aureibaculum conchae]|uniref:hypothetical protein n=1 Tax=Aureibaculum sp. 2308TA14-22 TaxID=3108392 RepID=UPI003392905A
MAPNKFEQHIKDALEKREIKPNLTAWDKISEKLDTPQKSKKNNYLWLGIAACFAGLLIISTIYFNYDKTDTNATDTIVDTNKDSTEIKNDEATPLLENIEEVQIVNTTRDKQEKIEVSDKPAQIKPEKLNNYPQKDEIIEVATVIPKLEVELQKEKVSTEKIIQQKIAEVIAKVNKLEQNDEDVTDSEVDSLIIKAQQELLQNKIFRQNQSIDALTLLYEVEDELNKPLKDQLFDLLKKGIFETKNAIAAKDN